jgi:hypothetical protein
MKTKHENEHKEARLAVVSVFVADPEGRFHNHRSY